MKRPRARLIYNPSAGKEAMRLGLPDILDILESGGYEVSTAMTHGSGDATVAARQACEDRFDYIFAAGGDGTINEVINGMARMDHRPTLGIIPAGTTNDLGRALNLPRDIRRAAEVLTEQHIVPMDIGQVGDGYFINIAAMGRITEITFDVSPKLKTYLGRLAYYAKGFEKLPWVRPVHLKVESPDASFEGSVMLCLIANSNSIAGFEKMVPDASLRDGLFDVLVVESCSVPELMRLASLAMKGEHFKSERVQHFKTDQLSVTSHDLVEINLDGENGGPVPRTFSCLKHHLNVLVPRSEIGK